MNTLTSSEFLTGLAKVSAQAAVLVLVVLAVQWLFRKQLTSSWRAALWMLVMIRLLLPISLSSGTSIFNLVPSLKAPPIGASARGGQAPGPSSPRSTIAVIQPSFTEIERSQMESATLDAPVIHESISTPLATTPSPLRPSWPKVLLAIWLLGVASLSFTVLFFSLKIGHKLRVVSRVSDEATLNLFAQCREELGITQELQLFETSHLSTPALHGFLRPRLLLPNGFIHSFSSDQLRFVFLHELAHVKRKDIPLNWLMTWLQIAHWFNPFIWLGFARWRVDRELACDALALEAAGQERKTEYGRTILQLLENASRPLAAPGFVGILEDKRQLRERIRMIAAFAPARRWSIPAFMLIAAISAGGLTDAQKKAEAKADNKKSSSSETSSNAVPLVPAVITNGPSLKVIVLDAQSGKPLANAEVLAPEQSAFFNGKSASPRWITDAAGVTAIRLGEIPIEATKQNTWFVMAVRHPGFAPRSLSWSAEHSDARLTMPSEVTVHLHSGTSIGGEVHEEDATPAANLKVRIHGVAYQFDPEKKHQEFSEYFTGAAEAAAITDSRGRWEIPDFPTDLQNVNIEFIRPDGSSQKFSHALEAATFREIGESFDISALLERKAFFRLKKGFTVHGVVLDPAGKPLPNVLVKEATGLVNKKLISEFRTDPKGRFTLPNRDPRQVLLTVYPEDYAIGNAIVNVDGENPPVEIHLRPLSPLRVRVTDEKGEPLPEASVVSEHYKTQEYILDFNQTTDAKGIVVWTNAPLGPFAIVALDPTKKTRCKVILDGANRDVHIALREGMENEIILSGKALDADTGQPIKIDTIALQTGDREGFKNGEEIGKSEFRLPIPASRFRQGMYPAFQLQITATGYNALVTDWRDFDEGDWNTEFRLRKAVPVSHTLLLSDGSPAEGAEITIGIGEHKPLLINQPGKVWRDEQTIRLKTDDQGHFDFNDPGIERIVLITHPEGFLETSLPELRSRRSITLPQWSRVEGTLREGRKPKANATIYLSANNYHGQQLWSYIVSAQTDSEGLFAFEQVPPGEFLLYRHVGGENGTINPSHQLPVIARPGQTTKVDYGGTGRPVIGRVDADLDWSHDPQMLILKQPQSPDRPDFDAFVTTASFEQHRDKFESERKRRELAQRTYQLLFERDGSFRVEDVPAGTYELRLRVTEPPKSRQDQWRPRNEIASFSREVIVPEMPSGRSDEPLDLGRLSLKWSGPKKETPRMAFSARGLDGKEISSDSFQGKPLLVAFWASWSERSTEKLAEIKKLYGAFPEKSVAFLNVNLADDPDTIKNLARERGYQWPQAFIEGRERAAVIAKLGVETLPGIILLDGQGHIIGRDLEPDRLKSALNRALEN
jgi:beta-lactamase regulating signal transducer with metallopeptidase domain/uncharacterized GH25 family protein